VLRDATRMSTALARVVAPETLDGLSEADPEARRSRRDLRRVHRAMGTRGAAGWCRLQAAGRCACWNSAPATAR
jgi:hypothetical protein